MTDLVLNTLSHDLEISPSGNISIIETIPSDVAQRIKIRLLFFKGEWFLNEEYGIPYFQTVFVKGTTQDQIDAIFKNTITSTPGVIRLISYSSEYLGSMRQIKLKFKIQTQDGTESLTIVLE